MEPKIFVFRVQRPEVFELPAVVDFINEALSPLFRNGRDAAAIWLELFKWSRQGDHGGATFLGYEDGKLLSLLIVEPPRSPFDPYPNVVYFQNLGSKKLVAEMRRQIIAHVRALGHKFVSVQNGTGQADSVYIRGVLGRGAKAQIRGSRIQWLVGDDGGSEGLVRG